MSQSTDREESLDMDTDLTDEQADLQRSARAFLEARVPTSFVRDMERDPVGYDRGLWKEMAALGWPGVMVPEEFGGSGLGFLELTILAEEVGRSLCPAPLLPTFIATLALLSGGSNDQQQRWLPGIAAGDAIWTPAFVEASGSWDVGDLSLRVTRDGDRLQLDGVKMFVQDAHVADWMIVVGVSQAGPVAVAVEPDRHGVELEALQTIGSDRQSRVRFDSVRVPTDHLLEGAGSAGWIEVLTQKAAVVECAYLTGLARKDLELAVHHATNRVQFGQPIGSFQAIQHACANMLSDVEGAWLTTYRAAWAVATGQADVAMSAAIAKAWTSEASSRVVSMCQQVSGAMGFTREYDAQLYFRRQKRAELFWGDADFHREVVASLLESAD
jgi:alkylation response protein AidB-like acyl-CoA dehydrogenase